MSQEVSCLACQSRKASNRAVRDFIANGFLPTNFTGIVLSESDGFLFLIQTNNARQVGLVGIEFGALPAVIDQLIGAYRAYLGQSIKGGDEGAPGNNFHNHNSGSGDGEEDGGLTGVTTPSGEG